MCVHMPNIIASLYKRLFACIKDLLCLLSNVLDVYRTAAILATCSFDLLDYIIMYIDCEYVRTLPHINELIVKCLKYFLRSSSSVTREHSLPGTFAPGNESAKERKVHNS